MSEKNFYERLLDLKNDVKIGKTVFNNYANFYYRTLEQIFEVLKPLEKKHKILFWLSEELIFQEEKVINVAHLEVIDGLTGEVKLTSKSFAEVQDKQQSKTKMNESQLSGSASSYAAKYVMSRALGLDDASDPDEEQPQQTTPKKVVPKREVEQTQNKTKALAEIKASTLRVEDEEGINALVDKLEALGGDDQTKRTIDMRARQLGLRKNIHTKKYGR